MQQILTLEECNGIISTLEEEVTWQKTSNREDLSYYHSPFNNTYFSGIEVLKRKVKIYAKEYLGLDVNQTPITVLKYLPGDFIANHIDKSEKSLFNKNFIYNINLLLNDDFTGGELYINGQLFSGNGPGVMYHYRSDTYHEVKTVTSGVRYCLISNIRSSDIIKEQKVLF